MVAMSNVWVSIACRASGSVYSARRPLLQLFNGYQKSLPRLRQQHRPQNSLITLEQQWHTARAFSGVACLAAKNSKDKRKQRPVPPGISQSSKSETTLQPATIIASHTEGLPKEEEPLTWRDYDPAGGMPLPSGELSQSEINAVFDSENVNLDTGNYVLSVMHWRRLSGAMIDVGLDFPKDSGVDREMAFKGLQYVRAVIPEVDESATGQKWAEEESERLQEEMHAKAVKLGLYKADTKEGEEHHEEEQQGTEYGRARTGESVLQTIRQAKEAEWEQEQAHQEIVKQKEASVEAHTFRGPLELEAGVQPMIQRVEGGKTIVTTMPAGVSIRSPPSKAWLQPVERKPWVKYYEDQATIIKENAVPKLSTVRRLATPFLVVLLVLAGCCYLSINYAPPPTSARIWPEIPPAAATLYAITGVLVGTFLLGRVPPLWRFYSKYMVLVPAYPYALSLIGATFRHDTAIHLASNLASLWLFGLLLHEDVGRGTFLAIYLASGVTGAYTSLLYNVARKQWMAYILGSSGSVLGVAAAAVAVRPNGNIRVFGYDVPIAAWVFLALFTGAEAVAVVRGLVTSIDHAGHLGGIATGVASGLWLRSIVAGERTAAAGMSRDTAAKMGLATENSRADR